MDPIRTPSSVDAPSVVSEPRHLSNAPIREAMVDLHFEPAATLDAVTKWAETWSGGKGKIQAIWEGGFQIKVDSKAGPQPETLSAAQTGRRVDLDGGRNVLQARCSAFTYSRLPPYDDFDSLKRDALSIWHDFSMAVGAEKVVRSAVRYINLVHIPLPMHPGGFEHYLACPLKVPNGLPQLLGSFMSRLNVTVDDQTSAFITQALEGETDDGKALKLLIDIDAVHGAALPMDLATVGAVLDRLRGIKNTAFFGCLNEPALEPYR